MREINNNQSNLNFPKVEIKKDVPQPAEVKSAEEAASQLPVTEDLSLSPEAVIGRSQVQMAGVNKAAIEDDMKTLAQNPQAIQKAVIAAPPLFSPRRTALPEIAHPRGKGLY